MLTLNDGRSELWQWDTGRTLSVDADCSQVHFSNKVFGRSIDVDVLDGVAIIPDVLLQTDKELIAWAFVGTSENGYTKISKVFKVNRRNKPADYVFTPPDQTSLEEIKEKIEYMESIQDPDAIKNAVEDYLEQNPVEAPVQSVNGKTGTVELTSEDVGAISRDDLQEATNEALAKAKESGEFDGADGKDGGWYTPAVTQPDKNTIEFAFIPSKDGMSAVAPVSVELPDSGGIGDLEHKKISSEALNSKGYDTTNIFGNVSITQARDTLKASLLAEYLIEIPEGAKAVKYVVKDGFLRSTDDSWVIATVTATKTSGVWNTGWKTEKSFESTEQINQTYSKYLTVSARVNTGYMTDFNFNLDCIEIYFDTDEYKHDYIDELRSITEVFTDKLSKRLTELDASAHSNRTSIENVYTDLFISSEFIQTSNYKTKVSEFSALYNNTENVESFLFFTDPHLLGHGYNESAFRKYIGTIEKAYNSSPCAYAVCGGDWLVNNDTQAEACEKLGYLAGVLKSKFRNMRMIVGNHDYNYQGIVENGSPENSGTLSASTIKNLWYPKEQANYYKFHDALSDCYVFDTDRDWNGVMTDYRKEQAYWFAESLFNNSEEHILMFSHIYTNRTIDNEPIQNPFFLAKWVADIAIAFNNRTAITVYDNRYDFSSVHTGKVHAFFAGHTHYDVDGIYNGLPIIVTTNATSGNVPTFDLVLVDYDKNVVNLKRVGNGTDRIIQLN